MQSVMNHSFAQVPSANIGRSQFDLSHGHKTTIDTDYLYPVMHCEVLPGDTFNVRGNFFARMTTPIHPIMDNLHLDTFYFYVPYRILWLQWDKFLGVQDDPDHSIDYTIPIVTSPTGGWATGTLFDYMGVPPDVDVDAGPLDVNAFPFRAYRKIWMDWFRDQNLQDSPSEYTGDGPDPEATYVLRKRGKRHDYFTSALPWTQKQDTAVSLPLGTSAPVITDATQVKMGDGSPAAGAGLTWGSDSTLYYPGTATTMAGNVSFGDNTGLQADLSNATAATINAIRLAVTTQQFLERDARGGTRINEIILSHFGVTVPDYRVQRPEYLGGSSDPVTINTVAQTSETSVTAQGTLAGFGTAFANGNGFTKSFTEHGIVMCLVNVRADLTYQQGLHKSFTRQTRYDLYWPEFQNIGEQVVQQGEIELTGTATDDDVFGYQERYAEYRFMPSRISGKFRSSATGTLHAWHLSENLTTPALDSTFIESNTPMSRVLAVAGEPNFILDTYFNIKAVRPMAMYGQPGLARF